MPKKRGEKEKLSKEWLICSIVIILVVSLNIVTQKYTEESVDYIDNILKDFKETLSEDEIIKEDAELKINDIMSEWQDKYNLLAYFIEHDELEKVETEITLLKANIEVEQYKEAIPILDKCAFILNHIKDKFTLEIKNIF